MTLRANDGNRWKPAGGSSVGLTTSGMAYDRTRRRRHGQHHSSANTEHHSSANTKHPHSANTEHHRSANTEHHSNANTLELGSVPPVDVQVGDEIGQGVKTPVATTCNLYDRVSLLPSEEDVEDDDDDSAADVHLVVHNSGNPHDADKGGLGDPLPAPVNNYGGLTLPFHIQTPGSPLEEEWAKLITQTWDRKYVYQQMKPIWDKYPTPENLLDSVYTPTMNEEIQKLFEKWQEKNDEKH